MSVSCVVGEDRVQGLGQDYRRGKSGAIQSRSTNEEIDGGTGAATMAAWEVEMYSVRVLEVRTSRAGATDRLVASVSRQLGKTKSGAAHFSSGVC